MTPIAHVASAVVALVSAHSILVTQELHGGIDLARQLVSGEQVPASEHERIVNAHNVLQERYSRLTLVASIFA